MSDIIHQIRTGQIDWAFSWEKNEWTTQYPSMGEKERLCKDCVHWNVGSNLKSKGCTHRRTHYCLHNSKNFFKRKTEDEFLSEEDFDL